MARGTRFLTGVSPSRVIHLCLSYRVFTVLFLAFDIPLNSDIIYILDYHGLLKSGVTGKIYKYLSRRNGMSAQSVPLARRDASWGIYKAIFRGRASS